MNKKGNVTLAILPVGICIIIMILVSLLMLYIQISVQVYDIKSNMFYLVQSSLSREDYENMAYNSYNLNEEKMKNNLNKLLTNNYTKVKNRKVGIIKIECEKIKLISVDKDVVKHTNGKYQTPVICVNVKVEFVPLINIIDKGININLHDDIKLSLLKFN